MMKYKILFVFVFTVCAFISNSVFAEVKLSKLDLKIVTGDFNFTDFAWNINVESDKEYRDCDLWIFFKDIKGNELHVEKRSVSLSKGVNKLTGEGVCPTRLWKDIENYETSIKCD